eukprot:UN32974
MAFAASEEDSHKFLHLAAEEFEPHIERIQSQSLKTCLRHGISYIHEYTTEQDLKHLKLIFEAGATQVIVVERSLAWGLQLKANMVIILGTSYYEGSTHTYEDYKIADIIKMMSYAQKPEKSREVCTAVVFTHNSKTDFYKKFLQDPFPVESHLDWDLCDHLNAEIVSKTIENAGDAVDLLTWTFYCTRLSQNPNYYSLKAVSQNHLSNHLSDLVEQTLEELESAGCVTKDEDLEVTAQNAGMIASYYYIRTNTVDIFSQALNSKRKLKGLIDILTCANEFEDIPVRMNEDVILERLARHMPLRISGPNYLTSQTKSNVLLQTHFSRHQVGSEIRADGDKIVGLCIPLLWAMIDLLSTEQWLNPTLICLELCQMITQALWDTDSPLMQLPHVTRECAEDFKKQGVEGVFDLVELEDDDRGKLLERFSQTQLADIAKVCNLYPNLEFTLNCQEKPIYEGKEMTVRVKIEREDLDDDEDEEEEENEEAKAKKTISVPFVNSPLYKKPKIETWFLVVGDRQKNRLLTVKRFNMNKLLMNFNLSFPAPERAGKYEYAVF